MSTQRNATTGQPHGRTASDSTDTGPEHDGRRFPVTIVRPAQVRLPQLSPVQRHRRARATAFAEAMARRVRESRPLHDIGYDCTVTEFLDMCTVYGWYDLGVPAIPQQALALLAHPTPDALAVCRTDVGRIIAVTLHGPQWSLVLRPNANPPLLWIYLDSYAERLGYPLQTADREATTWRAMADALADAARITSLRGTTALHLAVDSARIESTA